ncbi:tyrosine-type recombinase/integrase [Zavarzinia sp. CC-PAN008]|uniref:tyrosine-type recombinase/integrase n=1 Tax=Zavarzinia sp. CC-PAN008 TaxID=3243332 RepID=UPI003F742FC5
MAKQAKALTVRQVQALSIPGFYADGGGLYVQVTKSGSKSWIYRFQLNGRRRDMGLGSCSVYSLAEARAKAQNARRLVAEGQDPIDARQTVAAVEAAPPKMVLTFQAVAEAYVEAKTPQWNKRTVTHWEASLRLHVYPSFGTVPITEVGTAHVLEALKPIWTTKTVTAQKVRQRIEMILDAAKVAGSREGENPARWRGHLSHMLAAPNRITTVKHFAAVPHADMPAFWVRLKTQGGMGALALQLAILTATRTAEVLGAVWSEIDLDAGTWTIPAERRKGIKNQKLELRVPLSEPAVTLLRKLKAVQLNQFVFPGQRPNKPLSNMTMEAVLRRMDVAATPHGTARATFRTWAEEQTSFATGVMEAALDHAPRDAVIAAYQRGDLFEKRRQLMNTWSAFVERAR